MESVAEHYKYASQATVYNQRRKMAFLSPDTAFSLSALLLLYHSATVFFGADAQAAKHYGELYATDASKGCTSASMQWFGLAVAHQECGWS